MRVLRQGVQTAAPHEGPLPSAHGRAALQVHALRQDLLTLHHSQGAREDALPKVCPQVPILTRQPRGRGGRGGGPAPVAPVVGTEPRMPAS